MSRGICSVVWVTMLSAQLALTQPTKSTGQAVDSEHARALVQDLASEALNLEDGGGRKRVSVSGELLTYDFRPMSLNLLVAQPDRLTAALEILIRVNVLRRDFPVAVAGESFWSKPLNDLEALTASMVTSAYKTASDDEWSAKQRDYQAEAAKQFANLEVMLLEYASRSKLSVLRTRDPIAGYRVTVRIEPPKTHVQYMPYLDYIRCRILNKLPDGAELGQRPCDAWNELYEGTTTLIGRYHYRAEWPASSGGPEESNFPVRENGMITFRPNSK